MEVDEYLVTHLQINTSIAKFNHDYGLLNRLLKFVIISSLFMVEHPEDTFWGTPDKCFLTSTSAFL